MTGVPVACTALISHPMDSYCFKKAERLCSKTLIDNLFSKGNRVITQFPFRVLWQFVNPDELEAPAQVLISVSKRHMNRATQRNRIKRQIRELYRLRKSALYQELVRSNKAITIAIIFQGKTIMPHAQLNVAFEQMFAKLMHQLEKAV